MKTINTDWNGSSTAKKTVGWVKTSSEKVEKTVGLVKTSSEKTLGNFATLIYKTNIVYENRPSGNFSRNTHIRNYENTNSYHGDTVYSRFADLADSSVNQGKLKTVIETKPTVQKIIIVEKKTSWGNQKTEEVVEIEEENPYVKTDATVAYMENICRMFDVVSIEEDSIFYKKVFGKTEEVNNVHNNVCQFYMSLSPINQKLLFKWSLTQTKLTPDDFPNGSFGIHEVLCKIEKRIDYRKEFNFFTSDIYWHSGSPDVYQCAWKLYDDAQKQRFVDTFNKVY